MPRAAVPASDPAPGAAACTDPAGEPDAAAGAHSPACVVDSALYIDGRRARDVPVSAIGGCIGRPDGLLWIGLRDPETEILLEFATALRVGAKAIEEITQPHRRAKVVDYGSAVLVVAVTVELKGDRPAFGETAFLIGPDYLLTVRRGAVAGHVDLRARLEAAPELISRGSDFVASELLDLLVDRYVDVAVRLETEVEELEQKLLLRGLKDADIRRLYRLRRDLLRIHGAVSPLAEICRRLSRVEATAIDTAAKPFFLEVADRVQRVDEAFGALRETLAFAFEASLMIGQTQQNETMRRLAAWAAILAVPTALAGVYGMNFEMMPELRWAYGYPAIMAVIGAVCAFLYWRFRRAGWL
jgi:magnesium transporter